MAKPVKFPLSNFTLTAPEGERDVIDLPTYRDSTHQWSCWKLSMRERLSVLLFGRVWLGVRARTHPPLIVWGIRDAVIDLRSLSLFQRFERWLTSADAPEGGTE